MNISKNISIQTTCYHCGEDCEENKIVSQTKSFCCEGCKLVFEILNENDLCKYYDITQTPGITVKGKYKSEKFDFLNDPSVKAKLLSFSDGKQAQGVFYLPQMHCSSCIWLLENLHKINPGVIRSTTNFPRKEATILYNEQETSLKNIVELLAFIGYEPSISLNDLEKKSNKKFNKKQIYKIGIAGFCFGNIMMLSFPEYFSIGTKNDQGLKILFTYLNLLLSLPIFFYCASDFFISSYKGIQQKLLNIDAPIALAIVVTFGRSIYEIISKSGAGYLDSMSGIVFFMLIGRYFQNKTYDTISFERDYKSYFPISSTVIKENKETTIPISNLKIGERIIIRNNEMIPADAILFKGEASIDYSFVTGESDPVQKIVGEIIYAGGKQVGSQIELEIIKEVSQSYLTQLWNNDAFQKKEKQDESFIHKTGKYFSYFLLVLALGAFAFWVPSNMERALSALTAVLIVACPCALLLSATFTNGNVLRIFGRNKFYLKNAETIEKLGNIDTIVFDKTGTITEASDVNVNYEGKNLSEIEIQLIRTLVIQSNHPLSKAIVNYLPLSKKLPIHSFKEYPGKGTEAYVNGYAVQLGSYEFVHNNSANPNIYKSGTVYLKIESAVYGIFIIQKMYRSGFHKLANDLKKNYDLFLLSGDNDAERAFLTPIFENNAKLNFNQSPGQKLDFIKSLQLQHKNVAMIGDGLNDAGALKQSNVGIAISDNINNFSPACDAILDGSKFNQLKTFLSFSKSTKKIIIASFILSLAYNAIGLAFAVQGELSPVIAAILMPISSISIVLFTTSATNILAKKLKM